MKKIDNLTGYTKRCKIPLMMRLACLVLLITALSASANGNAQTVSLHYTNVDVRVVFTDIRKQTGYDFFYLEEHLDRLPKVTINENNRKLEDILAILFKNTNITWKISGKFIALTYRNDPDKQVKDADLNPISPIKGRVLNENGEPLEGVTISVKGQGTVAITNTAGEFHIDNIASDAILVFSSVNTEQTEIKVDGRKLITVSMRQKVNTLGEVTIQLSNGLQAVPKERSTGSFTYINNKTLNLQTGATILDRLNGVASGVLFDDTKTKTDQKRLSLNIHGLSTINGPQDPLIVLDNFVYEGNLDNINPNIVESVTILKDAAASSIWGSRAGNGVIVITTKKGRFNQPLRVDVNSYVQVVNKPDLYYQPAMSIKDYVDVERMLYDKGYFTSGINLAYTPLTPVVDALYKRDRGLLTSQQAEALISNYTQHDSRYDYNNYFYQKAVSQQYALNAYGGSGNIAYVFSAGYDKKISELDAPNNRLTLRMENTYKPFKFLQLTGGVTFTQSRSETGKPSFNAIKIGTRSVPYLSFANSDGSSTALYTQYRSTYLDTAGGGLLDWRYYPLEDYKHNKTNTALQELIGNLGVTAQILPGVSINVLYQYQKQTTDTRNLADTSSYSTRNIINQFTQINRTTGAVTYIVPVGAVLRKNYAYTESQNFRAQLNINRTIWKGDLSAILGNEVRETKIGANSYTLYGYNDNILANGNTDFLNPYPTFPSGSPGYVPSGVGNSEKLNRFVSYYGNASYTVLGKYTLSGSVRRDASNLFGVNTNDKWNPFWSVGAGWDISKESYYSLFFIPYLKFRATYGISGNVDLSKSAETVIGNYGTSSVTGFTNANIIQFYNPDLKWEKIKTFNIGFDFALPNQVVSGSIDYYHKNGTNLFGLVPLDYTTGLGQNFIVKNVADMAGNGVDLNITSININRNKFIWSTNFLFNYNLCKTTKYYQGNGTWGGILGTGTGISPAVGKPLYAIASRKWAGLDNKGNPQGYLNDKLSTDYIAMNANLYLDSLQYNGPASPPYFGSIGNTIQYKGFALTINVLYKFGYYFRRNTISYSSLFSTGLGNSDFALRWQQPGDELKTSVPSMIYPADSYRDGFYQQTDATVEKADHIRLQFINLSYDLKNSLIKSHVFKSVVLYINASNLGIIWRANRKGIDPDYVSGYPNPKTFAVGARFNF